LLNQNYLAQLEKYRTKGWILEHIFKVKGAEKDPQYQYAIGDAVQCAIFQAQAQAQIQVETQKQMAEMQQPAPGGGGGAPGGGQPAPAPQQPQQEGPITSGLDQVINTLSKSEQHLSPTQKAILAKQKRMLQDHISALEVDSAKALDDVMEIASKYMPPKE
jgi:hypothetical protein